MVFVCNTNGAIQLTSKLIQAKIKGPIKALGTLLARGTGLFAAYF